MVANVEQIQTYNQKHDVLKVISCNVLVILFLFFIDEGYYDFRWAFSIGNWVAFGLYFAIFFIGQFITYYILLRKYEGEYKATLTNIIGIPLALVIIYGIFALVV
jgi:hypothetical protein